MSKAILLVICDFLLLSLLALAKFDVEEAEKKVETQPETVTDAGPEGDLIAALQLSLEQERRSREQLDAALKQAESDLQSNRSALELRDKQVEQAERELALQQAKAREMTAEQEALQAKLRQSQRELNSIEAEYDQSRARLESIQRQYATTQASLESLEQRYEAGQSRMRQITQQYQESVRDIESMQQALASAQSEARINQQLVAELQSDLGQRVAENRTLQQDIAQLDLQRQAVLTEKQQLATDLKVVDTERRMTQQQLDSAQKQIYAVREEKAVIQQQATQLAENVSTLADQSGKLTDEIRQARPLTPNAIFSEFVSNQVHSSFQAGRLGLFGQSVKKDQALRTVLFRHGGQIYAVFHVKDTPFEYTAIGTEWDQLFVTLRRADQYQTLAQLTFLDRDPRILIAPVTEEQATAMGVGVYPVSAELFKFDGAVLVGANDHYYGECEFQIDPEVAGYMKMRRARFGKLFGKFVPSRGDLVFSKTGELIGVMANEHYCLVLDQLQATRKLTLGSEVPKQLVAAYFSQMYFQLEDLPFRLR